MSKERLNAKQVLKDVKLAKKNNVILTGLQKKYTPSSMAQVAKKHKVTRQAITYIVKKHDSKNGRTKRKISDKKV